MTNFSHLTYEDRCNIESELNNGTSINQIAQLLNKHHSTILREIKNNKSFREHKKYYDYKNPCAKRNSCYKKFCDFKKPCYEKETCSKLLSTPYVCNFCKSRSGCRKERFIYYAKTAHLSYEKKLIESRSGINLTDEEIYEINKIIAPLIKEKNQSVNHIYINHPELLPFSKTTFYNYVNLKAINIANIDLPRQVRYKQRKNKKRRTLEERSIRINRSYEDFIKYIELHPDTSVVEMDCVEGSKGGKVFLTLLWRKSNFMLIFLLDTQTMNAIDNVFEYLQQTILINDYKKLFEVILTDNGSEFFNPLSFEINHKTGEKVTNLFYCDAGASYQKGALEKNHEFIRYILPKKTSFNDLTQDDCNIISCHINSLCRDSLNGNCPFKAMLFQCKEQILNNLNIYYLEPDNVILNNTLIKNNFKNFIG